MFIAVCAFFGVGAELAFTAFARFRDTPNWHLRGDVSLWMFPVYGSIGFVFPFIMSAIGGWPVFLRAPFHGVWIMAGESLWGFALDKGFNVRPWHYTARDAFFNGYTRAAYYPLWCAFGLGIELLYSIV